MNGLRIVAVGRYAPVEEVYVGNPDMLDDDAWINAIFNQSEALPVDPPDFVSPDFLGAFDADEGLPCEPTQYFAKLTDIEQYVIGFRDAVGAWEAVTVFTQGQRARWLYKPFLAPMRGMDVVVEEVDGDLITIRVQGPDGDYWRKVQPKKLFVIPTESEVAIL